MQSFVSADRNAHVPPEIFYYDVHSLSSASDDSMLCLSHTKPLPLYHHHPMSALIAMLLPLFHKALPTMQKKLCVDTDLKFLAPPSQTPWGYVVTYTMVTHSSIHLDSLPLAPSFRHLKMHWLLNPIDSFTLVLNDKRFSQSLAGSCSVQSQSNWFPH